MGSPLIPRTGSGRIIRVCADGEQQLILEDCDYEHVDSAERAFLAGELTRAAIYNSPSNVLKHLSSLAFGGPDLRTVFLGSLGGSSSHTSAARSQATLCRTGRFGSEALSHRNDRVRFVTQDSPIARRDGQA
jgi:hypothetical protein